MLTTVWYFSLSGWDPTVGRNSNITTALWRSHLSRALAVTKAAPRQSRRATGYHLFCCFLCWCQPKLFRMPQEGWVQRGLTLLHQRLEGQHRTAGWESGAETQQNRTISILSPVGKMFLCCLKSQQRKWVFQGHHPMQGGMEGSQLRRKPCSTGSCLWAEELPIMVALALPSWTQLLKLFIS